MCVCVCVSQTFSPSTSFPLHHLLTYFDPHPAIIHANGVRHLIYGGRHHIWPIMQWGLCVWPQSFCSGLRAPDCLRYTWACCRLFLFIAGWTVGMCDMNVYGECKECVLLCAVWLYAWVYGVWQKVVVLQMAGGKERCVVALIQPAILVSTNQGLPVPREAWVHLPKPCEQHTLCLSFIHKHAHTHSNSYAMFGITC